MCRVASFRQQVGGRTSLVPCRGVDKIRNRQNQLPHHLPESELLNTVLQLLAEQGYEGFAEGGRLLVNEAIHEECTTTIILPPGKNNRRCTEERASVLQAQPYGRTETRLGPANGYQAQTVAITFQVPQVRRKTAFYPSALEKGLRSERAFKLALAEMYGLGVFTRKASAIVGKLYGFAVGSPQVSQCSAQSDAELRVWRERPLGAFACLIVDARCENFRHDGQNHRTLVDGVLVDTGRRKFGSIIGDGVHTGIHTSIYPGRKLWPGTSTRPGEIVQRDVH